jgi:hypothetical protein
MSESIDSRKYYLQISAKIPEKNSRKGKDIDEKELRGLLNVT